MSLFLADWIVEHLLNIEPIAGLGYFGVSAHVVAMLVASVALLLVFIPFGNRIKANVAPTGPFVNALEAVLLFLRDEVSRPFLGKAGDKFLPVIWSFFFFILFVNLLGLLPWTPPFFLPVEHGDSRGTLIFAMVTATSRPEVTGALAGIAFIWWHGLGIKEQGLVAYIRHIVPSGLPLWLVGPMFVLELVSHIVKPVALCIRLAANMTGGHAVLFAVLGFIFTFGPWLGLVSVPAGVAVFLLEIFVAFLQAYVFTFLVVVFLGGALHPH